MPIAVVLHPHSKQRRLSRGCEPTERRSGRTEHTKRQRHLTVSVRIGSVSERMMTSIRVTGGNRRDEASEASAGNSACAAAGRQIDGFARLRSGDGAPRFTTRCQLDGSHRELPGWSSFDGSARSPEEGSFPARVPRQLCVVLHSRAEGPHSRAEAPRLRRYRGTVLGLGPRQTSFGLSRAYYRGAAPQLQIRCTPRPKCQQSQKCLKVNKIHYFSQIISIIVIVSKLVRFRTIGCEVPHWNDYFAK